jgi:hypothetical protein
MKQNKETSCKCFKRGRERVHGERWWGQSKPMYNISLFRRVAMNPPPVHQIYLNKNKIRFKK